MAYFARRSWDNATLGRLLAWQEDNQASNEDAARRFLSENEALWTEWVTPEAAAKIGAAL